MKEIIKGSKGASKHPNVVARIDYNIDDDSSVIHIVKNGKSKLIINQLKNNQIIFIEEWITDTHVKKIK